MVSSDCYVIALHVSLSARYVIRASSSCYPLDSYVIALYDILCRLPLAFFLVLHGQASGEIWT